MDTKSFARLKSSVEEMVAIKKGEALPSRSYCYKGHVLIEIKENGKRVWHIADAAKELAGEHNPDPKTIREHLQQSQEGFAELLGISVGTLRGWEQGRREPRGPARMLLNVAARHPTAVLDAAETSNV